MSLIVAAVLLVAVSFALHDEAPVLSDVLSFAAIVSVVLWVLLAVVAS